MFRFTGLKSKKIYSRDSERAMTTALVLTHFIANLPTEIHPDASANDTGVVDQPNF